MVCAGAHSVREELKYTVWLKKHSFPAGIAHRAIGLKEVSLTHCPNAKISVIRGEWTVI
jgi:hypothetical protein